MSKAFLRTARAYLSGPMDFVASRDEEKTMGWRVRVRQFLKSLGVTVFDPWSKPRVLGRHDYGREDTTTQKVRENWTFESGQDAAKRRKDCADAFRETLHIDLRMIDSSDFVMAYCPTNIYSVGTPHEIVVATQQHKPVLVVSPPVEFPALNQLQNHLESRGDKQALKLLEQLKREVPIKPNQKAVPSLWYMPLVGSENFFDGFGFDEFRNEFNWPFEACDQTERQRPPQRPILGFLKKLHDTGELPKKWSKSAGAFVIDDDWLLLDYE